MRQATPEEVEAIRAHRASMAENCKVNDCHKRELTYEIERLRAEVKRLEEIVRSMGGSV